MLQGRCSGRQVVVMTLSVHIWLMTQPQLSLMTHWPVVNADIAQVNKAPGSERSADFPRDTANVVAVIVICWERCKSNLFMSSAYSESFWMILETCLQPEKQQSPGRHGLCKIMFFCWTLPMTGISQLIEWATDKVKLHGHICFITGGHHNFVINIILKAVDYYNYNSEPYKWKRWDAGRVARDQR